MKRKKRRFDYPILVLLLLTLALLLFSPLFFISTLEGLVPMTTFGFIADLFIHQTIFSLTTIYSILSFVGIVCLAGTIVCYLLLGFGIREDVLFLANLLLLLFVVSCLYAIYSANNHHDVSITYGGVLLIVPFIGFAHYVFLNPFYERVMRFDKKWREGKTKY